MDFENYRFIYLNFILCLLLISNQFYLFCLFFSFKLPYLLNLETEIEYEFDYEYINHEDNDTKYLENDIDDEYFYTLIYQEFYILANCKFQFEFYGGNTALDYIDFLDFIIYNIHDARNYKYIYENEIYYQKYVEEKINKWENDMVLLSIKNNYNDNNYNLKYIKKLEELENKGIRNKENIVLKNQLYNLMANHTIYENIIKKNNNNKKNYDKNI